MVEDVPGFNGRFLKFQVFIFIILIFIPNISMGFSEDQLFDHDTSQIDGSCVLCHIEMVEEINTEINPDPQAMSTSGMFGVSSMNSSSDISIIIAPGTYSTQIGPTSGYSYKWWGGGNNNFLASIMVMNSSNVIPDIDWAGSINDMAIGRWFLGGSGANASFVVNRENTSNWWYPQTQIVPGKKGSYFNVWEWTSSSFPSPNTGLLDEWYDENALLTDPLYDELKVNLSLDGYDYTEESEPFLVTPITCGKYGCHSNNDLNRHIGVAVPCDDNSTTLQKGYCDIGYVSAGCGLCHGNKFMTYWGRGYSTVHPHEIETHRDTMTCSQCHPSQLHGIHNSPDLGNDEDERCVSCHGDLSFPDILDSSITLVEDVIGDYRPVYPSGRENVKTYLMNKTDDSNFSLYLDCENVSANMDLFIFNKAGENIGSNTTVNNSEIYSNSSPAGIYIVKVTWSIDNPPWIPDSNPPMNFNLTSDQGYIFQEKPIIDDSDSPSFDCSRCHPLPGSQLTSVPDWDTYRIAGSYSHADIDSDGDSDVECRFCHSSFHNIKVSNCKDCHQRPQILSHSTGLKWGSFWTSELNSCTFCHGNTNHEINALGHASSGQGPDPSGPNDLNQTSWCGSCHFKGDSEYDSMTSNLTDLPPEITNGSWLDMASYYNHTINESGNLKTPMRNYNDSECFKCHTKIRENVSMYMFMHNIENEPLNNCIECHGYDPGIPMAITTKINISSFYEAIHPGVYESHASLDKNDTVTNNACYYCHQDMDMTRDNINRCKYCHTMHPTGWRFNSS